MNKAEIQTPLRTLAVAASAVIALLAGSASVAASTDTTEPASSETMATDTGHTMVPAAQQAVDGSAEASSPEAEAFCTAEVAAEAAFGSEDPAQIGPAAEALAAAAPTDLAPTVEALLAAGANGPEDPAFIEAYGEVIEYMHANCGFAELDLTATEYTFGGLPQSPAAGPTIITLENIGEEVHEVALVRVNDDVTLPLEELLALPEEESNTMTTFLGIAFAFPGDRANAVVDLTPGRYIALCFLPQNADPAMIMQMGGPEDTEPEGANFGPPHFTLGMVQELQVS